MDEQKFVKLLKEHFPSKADHEALRSEVTDLRDAVGSLRQEMHQEIGSLRQEMHQEIGSLRQEMRQEIGSLRQEMHQEIDSLRQETKEGFEEVKESIEDLKASSQVLDKILEEHPVFRIKRLEAHIGLPPYISASIEE